MLGFTKAGNQDRMSLEALEMVQLPPLSHSVTLDVYPLLFLESFMVLKKKSIENSRSLDRPDPSEEFDNSAKSQLSTPLLSPSKSATPMKEVAFLRKWVDK